MKKSILLALLVVSSSAYSKSLLDYVLNPKRLAPDAMSCALDEEDDLKKQCVQELCKGMSPDMYPMALMADKFESFMASHTNKPSSEPLKKAEKKFDLDLAAALKELDALIAGGNDGLIKNLSKSTKGDLVGSLYMSMCAFDIDPVKPEGSKVKVKCKEDYLQNNPARQSVTAYYENMLKDDWSYGMASGYYTDEDIAKKVPARENELKADYEKFKATNPADEESKKLIAFMDKNWGKYATLPYAERMKFVKGLDEIQTKKEGAALAAEMESGAPLKPVEDVSEQCSVPECAALFEVLVVKKDLTKKLVESRARIASPEFKKLAMASIKVDKTIRANAPTEAEIEAFDDTKEKVIEKILEVQKKHMSEHSYTVYEEKLKTAKIGLDQDQISSDDEDEQHTEAQPNQSNQPEAEPTPTTFGPSTILEMALGGDSTALPILGADQGSPIFLISDHYIDPKYKNFDEEDFEVPVINYSLFSLKEKAYGEQILAHELGHHFSHVHMAGEFSELTTKYIDTAKGCVKSRYDKFKAANDLNAGDHYLEEEFADEFGFSVSSGDSKLLFCPILVTPYDPETHLSLEVMGSPDNHPQDLWRSLNQLKHSGREIPLPCKELMLKNSESYEYKKCL